MRHVAPNLPLPVHYCQLAASWLAPSCLLEHFARSTPRPAPGVYYVGSETLQHAVARQGGFRPPRSGGRAALCLRPDGLRLRSYRQRPPAHRLRRALSPAAPSLSTRTRQIRAQHHRRRRQDQRPRGGAQDHHPRTDRRDQSRLSGGRAGAGLSCSGRAAARHRPYRRDDPADRIADRVRPRLRGRRPRVVRRSLDAGLRPPVAPSARGHDRRRAGRRRSL